MAGIETIAQGMLGSTIHRDTSLVFPTIFKVKTFQLLCIAV